MKIEQITGVCFSPTGTTRKIVTTIGAELSSQMEIPFFCYDFTLPQNRKEPLTFSSCEMVLFAVPVYAGRVPNVLLKYLETLRGKDTLAVPIVLFGNRNYDDALIELRDILEKGGLKTIAAAAFVGEHSFSKILGKGRPDKEDLSKALLFAANIASFLKNNNLDFLLSPVPVSGTPFPYHGYYKPQDRNHQFIDIRKVKPLTNENCDNCKICAAVCPMGSIDPDDVRQYTGICIKCGACIKKCPKGAKYYDDPGYLYHKEELEEMYTRRAEPEFFYGFPV